MSRLLLDQNVDQRVGPMLVENGHDVVHLAERGMQRSQDHEVMRLALVEDRIVVTHDSDFAQLLARSGAEAPSVVRLRLPLADHQSVAALLHAAIEAAATDLKDGAIVSVSERGARVHRLPVGRSTD